MLARALQPHMSELARFASNAGRVWSAAFAPDGKRVLTTDDKSARMWDASSCQLLFRQPVPVSASARLDLASGHRLPLTVDGVLLMADTLVLGPGPQAHVPMPDLQQPVVLYRHQEGLAVRYGGNLYVEGRRCHERAELGRHATVTGDDFAFAIEPVGTGMGRCSVTSDE